MQDFSLHNHSHFSDGEDSLFDVAKYAKKIGMNVIGFSDHFCNIQNLDCYVKEIRYVEKKLGLKILVGAEVDLPNSPEETEKLKEIKHKYDFDYFIGALHNINYGNRKYYVGNNNTTTWDINFQEKYWDLLPQLAQSGLFEIVAHFNLISQSGLDTEKHFNDKIDYALSEMHKAGQILEINTKHSESHPSDFILGKAEKLGIPFIFSSDSHSKENIINRFQSEEERIKSEFKNINLITKYENLAKYLNHRKK